MARQKSKNKKIALLESAIEIVAIQGVGAPTAQIAKRAGTAQGTLFRYFPTKDDLLNELFAYLEGNLGETLKRGFDEAAPLKDRICTIWNNYIDWGITHPSANNAMNQLAVSAKVRPEIYASAKKLCIDLRGVTDSLNIEGIGENPSSEFSEAILYAIAQVTITYAACNPNEAEAYKTAGFSVMWKGLAGE